MRHWVRCFMLCSILFLNCKNTPKPVVDIEESAADIDSAPVDINSTFEDLDGNPLELTNYKGSRVFLNYWATWCRPCIEEMPAMLKAQDLLSTEGYVFLLASDQSVEKIMAFKEKKNFDFNFIRFNGNLADQEIYALPVTFIYNSNGELVERIDGATDWESPELIERLKTIP